MEVLCRNPITLTPETERRLAIAINDMLSAGFLPEHVEKYGQWDIVFPIGSLDIGIKRPFLGDSNSMQVFASLPANKATKSRDIEAFIALAPEQLQHTLPKRETSQLLNRVMGDQLIEE